MTEADRSTGVLVTPESIVVEAAVEYFVLVEGFVVSPDSQENTNAHPR